jgi:cell division protein DivIC
MKKVLKVLSNKYLLLGAAFLIWNAFFDQNDWISLRQRQKELGVVKDNIDYLNTEIARMTKERDELLNNPAKLEKYARENFRMKHDGEDVYVIEK